MHDKGEVSGNAEKLRMYLLNMNYNCRKGFVVFAAGKPASFDDLNEKYKNIQKPQTFHVFVRIDFFYT